MKTKARKITKIRGGKRVTAEARTTCNGSGGLAAGLKVLDDPFAKAKKAHKPAPKSGSVKVECPVCGRRVGTYMRRKGEHEGQLTVESHWTPRARRSKAEVAQAV